MELECGEPIGVSGGGRAAMRGLRGGRRLKAVLEHGRQDCERTSTASLTHRRSEEMVGVDSTPAPGTQPYAMLSGRDPTVASRAGRRGYTSYCSILRGGAS